MTTNTAYNGPPSSYITTTTIPINNDFIIPYNLLMKESFVNQIFKVQNIQPYIPYSYITNLKTIEETLNIINNNILSLIKSEELNKKSIDEANKFYKDYLEK